MLRNRLDSWSERGILLLVLGILVFAPLATGAVRTLEFLIIQWLTGGIIGLWLGRLWLNPLHRFYWPPVCWAVMAFVAYAVVRYQQADLEYVAREEFIRILVYAFLFFAILNNLQRQEYVSLIVYTLLLIGVGNALYAGYQFFTGSNKVWYFFRDAQYDGRGSGTYICPNHLAGFLEMILPLGLAYTLTGRLGYVTRILVGYASLMILAGIGVSVSRGGWIATGLALIIFFGLLLRKRDYRLPALICLSVLLLAGVGFVMKTKLTRDRFQEMFAGGKLENMRFRLWKPALEIWRNHYWLGAGPAHFDYRFRAFRPEDVQMRPNRVHNDYLNTLTDWGLVGGVLVMAVWLGLFGGMLRTLRFVQRSNDLASKRSNRSAFVLGGFIGLTAILFHAMVDFNFHIPGNAIVAVTLMALLTSHLRYATEAYWTGSNVAVRAAFSALVLIGIGYLGWQSWVRYREYVPLRQAQATERLIKDLSSNLKLLDTESPEFRKLRKRIDEQNQVLLTAMRRAYEAERNNFETTYRIGEALRAKGWSGKRGFADLLQSAMRWFQRGMSLNPYDPYNYLRYGMCLHWLNRDQEAKAYFSRVRELDPNGYYTVAHQGWHLVTLGDYAGAKPWFERSLRLKPHIKDDDNPIAASYLKIVQQRLTEVANPRTE